MRLMLSALECDIDASPRLPSNAAGIYIKTSLNGGCVVTLYISNKGHKLNKMFTIPLICDVKTVQICQPGIKKNIAASLTSPRIITFLLYNCILAWCCFSFTSIQTVDVIQMFSRDVSTWCFHAAQPLRLVNALRRSQQSRIRLRDGDKNKRRKCLK